jgi:hypothetical protein
MEREQNMERLYLLFNLNMFIIRKIYHRRLSAERESLYKVNHDFYISNDWKVIIRNFRLLDLSSQEYLDLNCELILKEWTTLN